MNIIELAKEAGFDVDEGLFPFEATEDKYIGTDRVLERFAALVRADLMKQVMDICEAEYKRYDEMVFEDDTGHEECCALIHLMRKLEKLK